MVDIATLLRGRFKSDSFKEKLRERGGLLEVSRTSERDFDAENGLLKRPLRDVATVLSIEGKYPTGRYSISTDTRTLRKGEAFVALNGEKYLGKDFIEEALKKEASVVVVDMPVGELQTKYPNVAFISVSDTTLFLQQLAFSHRKYWQEKKIGRKVIGVTGSNGKTTTKEMLFHFMNEVAPGRVCATEKNFNNHIGVPKTLLSIEETHDYVIVEMGSNHPGEMELLCNIACPDVGIITNIGEAHLEFFGNREGVFAEKRKLFDKVMSETNNQGYFVLNLSDRFLSKLSEGKYTNTNIVTFSLEGTGVSGVSGGSGGSSVSSAVVRYDRSCGNRVEVAFGEKTYNLINNNIIGEHNFTNLAATFLLAATLFPEHNHQQLVVAATSFLPSENRSSWIHAEISNNIGKISLKRFYLDAYNANPSSMIAAIEAISEYYLLNKVDQKRQFYILGDMNELGPGTAEAHWRVGESLRKLGVKNIAFIGRYASLYCDLAGKTAEQASESTIISCSTKEEFVKRYWSDILEKYDYFFIKGSRSMQLESLLPR